MLRINTAFSLKRNWTVPLRMTEESCFFCFSIQSFRWEKKKVLFQRDKSFIKRSKIRNFDQKDWNLILPIKQSKYFSANFLSQINSEQILFSFTRENRQYFIGIIPFSPNSLIFTTKEIDSSKIRENCKVLKHICQ